MENPPEDSIFSLPIWKKSSQYSNEGPVQMDANAAMKAMESKKRLQQAVVGVGMVVVMVLLVGGGLFWTTRQQAPAVQASIDLKHAAKGTVQSLSTAGTSFTMVGATSLDPTVVESNVTTWTVQLPPGESLIKESSVELETCFSIANINQDLNGAAPVACQNLLHVGSIVAVEYLIIRVDSQMMFAKKIIVQP